MLRSQLALRRGLSLQEFAEQTSAFEFRHWKDFNRIEPVGDVRLDRLIAMLCRTIAQASSTQTVPDDAFDITWGSQIEELSPEAMAEEEENTKQAFRDKIARAAKKPPA